ncbi:hypothetical protein ZHAS_00004527 [Anopheles sinensis]|uniref:Uncharacterized protein n=1 Tax=Anopheles sinensis TaxID=74873 RepID=A0A084VH41_ANOSI|nr:hypothetical protein ZHAS_00004527 [Anopheles sinensis]
MTAGARATVGALITNHDSGNIGRMKGTVGQSKYTNKTTQLWMLGTRRLLARHPPRECSGWRGVKNDMEIT